MRGCPSARYTPTHPPIRWPSENYDAKGRVSPWTSPLVNTAATREQDGRGKPQVARKTTHVFARGEPALDGDNHEGGVRTAGACLSPGVPATCSSHHFGCR